MLLWVLGRGCGAVLGMVLLVTGASAQYVDSGTQYTGGTTVIAVPGAGSTITTSGNVTVGNGANLTYQAAGQIKLEPGFSVTGGGLFHAQIKQPQTITFGGLPNHSYGDAAFGLTATASSGLPVSYTVTGPATVAGSTVVLTGVGTVTVTASQAGDATYLPASTVSQSFTVSQGPQSISFAPIGQHAITDAPFAISATATSGLAVSFSVVSGGATVSGNTVTLTAPGSVTVRAAQGGNANYAAATPVDQTFLVTAPAGYNLLTVQNGGTASAAGGTSGQVITLSANVPAGQYFTGWIVVSGLGTFNDISLPNATFTVGGSAATIKPTYSATQPTYGVTWNEINLPAYISTYDANRNGNTIQIAAVVTNSGTAPWGISTYVSVSGPSGWVACCPTSALMPGGVPPGAKVPLSFGLAAPTSQGGCNYQFNIGPNPYSTNGAFGTMPTASAFATNDSGQRPTFPTNAGVYTQPGTVTLPYSLTPTVTDNPTGFSLTGTLPAGLQYSTSTGAFSGTPTQSGQYGVTMSAYNGAGYGIACNLITIYPNVTYSLTVQNGSGSLSAMAVGSSTTITAATAPAGQIFNGWTVVSGSPTIANTTAQTTTLTLSSPGNVIVQANYIAGYPLTVGNGTSNPLGGAQGAAVSITANADANGQMFDYWSTSGPGTISSPSSQSTTFTMGAGAATVQANFKAGYRLTPQYGTTASANGGTPGTTITVTAPATPSGQYDAGWVVQGPGYVIGSTFTMAAGPASIGRWSTTTVPLTVTAYPSAASVAYNQAFTVTAQVIDPHGAVTDESVDYSTDGGLTWVAGTIAAGTRWTSGVGGTAPTQPAPNAYNFVATYPANTFQPGTLVFRAKGTEANYSASTYGYCTITISNQSTTPAPTITAQPQSVTVSAGAPATFSVTASGQSLSYQWRKGGVALSGATSAAYSLSAAQLSDAGTYDVVVSNTGGSVTSSAATLTVASTLTITAQPQPQSVAVGASATFVMSASGSPAPTYQWQRLPYGSSTWSPLTDGGSYSGTATTTLTVSSVTSAMNGDQFRCLASNSGGSMTTTPVALTVSLGTTPDTANDNQLNIHIPF